MSGRTRRGGGEGPAGGSIRAGTLDDSDLLTEGANPPLSWTSGALCWQWPEAQLLCVEKGLQSPPPHRMSLGPASWAGRPSACPCRGGIPRGPQCPRTCPPAQTPQSGYPGLQCCMAVSPGAHASVLPMGADAGLAYAHGRRGRAVTMGHSLGAWAALLPSHTWSGWHWRLPCKSSGLRARAWPAAVSRAAHDGDVGVLGGLAQAAFASRGLLLRVWGEFREAQVP